MTTLIALFPMLISISCEKGGIMDAGSTTITKMDCTNVLQDGTFIKAKL